MAGVHERRASAVEFGERLNDFTKGFTKMFDNHAAVEQRRAEKIDSSLKKINETQIHMGAEYGQRFDNIDKTHDQITETLKAISETCHESSQRLAVHQDNISTLKKQTAEQYGLISDNTESVAGLKGKACSPKKPVNGGSIPISFWSSPNAKYVIWAGILLIVGLFAIAGVNMTESVRLK